MEQANPLRLDDVLALLERTPASLGFLLAGLPQLWLNMTDGHDTWSPYQVISHLINGEHTNWLPRVQHILANEKRSFEPFDRVPWPNEHHASSADELLARFAQLRQENIATLKRLNLSKADMNRTGQHPEFGEVTLGQLLATWAVHDLNHIGQIVGTMARVYTNAVGPWKAYLPILQAGEWSEE
jgi:hypothetical protein